MNGRVTRGQTSLDFLMTYGWALLLIVVVIGALFALGVFNVGSFTGPKATGFAQIGMIDWNVNNSGSLSLKLQNLAGMDIRVTGVTGSYGNSNFSYSISNVSIPNGKVSGVFNVGTIGSVASGLYYILPLKITYTDLNGFNYTESGTLSGTVGGGAVAPAPSRTAVDNYVWVTNSGDNTVSKIDKTTDTVSGPAIDVGNGPYGIAVDLDYVWTANNGGTTVSKVNKTTGVVEANITVSPNPGGIAVDHNYVWVSYGSGGTSAVSKVNKVTGSVDANITVGLSPYGVAVDSNYVWIANGADGTVSKIDKSNDSVVATITVSDPYTYPALVATDSAYVWVTIAGWTNVSKIAKANDSVVATIDVGSSPYGVAVDRDYVWVATCGANSVVKISKSNDSIVDTITGVGVCPSGISLDEDYVWAVSQNSNSVYKIDKSNDSIVATIPMGAGTYPASEGDATGYAYDRFFH